ncbi:hypothetical protein E1211_17910 [Micromonospora sp. 15K316]|uniref:hypothetical protein n=1 Tax=Micromonospora sp. 15K316 TaxID=2530376 RepID=UPI00104CBC87|nr:hypothetical protein [Micromonospora sp. 15K316]TDC34223.1 hypothetical protein E1211_17910 [Micromonospora sp. 15K316]
MSDFDEDAAVDRLVTELEVSEPVDPLAVLDAGDAVKRRVAALLAVEPQVVDGLADDVAAEEASVVARVVEFMDEGPAFPC